jgi:Na+-transporting NADH:ubiquinone oxidoreductase subunit C
MTAVAALILAFMATSLKSRQDRNEAIYNKRAIISAVEGPLGKEIKDLSDDEVQKIFDDHVKQVVVDMTGSQVDEATILERKYKGVLAENIDMAKEKKRPESDRLLPVFIFHREGKKYYIISIRGSGLWDEIWGNIAVEEDFNTIAGAAFDHKGETPGLGGEIKDNTAFPAQFIGKKLYDENGNYTSVVVRKGGARNPVYEVDGISGATITSNGVSEMLYRGIKYYEPYFNSIGEN